jgi:hypothetical protein
MIVVSVQLDSAISSSRDKELARVHIANAGGDAEHGDYVCTSMRGRGKAQLDRLTVNRFAVVKNHPRKREHVLNLVAKALNEMGYG